MKNDRVFHVQVIQTVLTLSYISDSFIINSYIFKLENVNIPTDQGNIIVVLNWIGIVNGAITVITTGPKKKSVKTGVKFK